MSYCLYYRFIYRRFTCAGRALGNILLHIKQMGIYGMIYRNRGSLCYRIGVYDALGRKKMQADRKLRDFRFELCVWVHLARGSKRRLNVTFGGA